MEYIIIAVLAIIILAQRSERNQRVNELKEKINIMHEQNELIRTAKVNERNEHCKY